MILKLIPACKALFKRRAVAIVYALTWLSILVFAWLNWDSLTVGFRIAISAFLVLTTPALSDLRGSR